MNQFKLTIKNLVLMGTLFFLTIMTNSYAVENYDIIKRARLVDDKINTLEITRPINHEFFLNIRALYAPEILDIIDEGEKFSKLDTSDTATAINTINENLEQFYDKEQIVKADIGLGFPLPSFRIKKLKIRPNFRVEGGVFAMVTPQKVKLNMVDIITNLSQIPVLVRDRLKVCLDTPPADGTDLLVYCVAQGAVTQIEVDQLKLVTGLTKIPYSTALVGTPIDTPSINMYVKAQAKVGFFNQYRFGKHFFGNFNLYGLGRMDIQKYADALSLMGGGVEFEYDENLIINLVNDFSFGYKNANYSVSLGVEEVKISELSRESEAGLNWGDSMLIRFHMQADFRVSIFKLRPYAGTHSRSGYGFGDAYYVGADWGLFVFKDRLGLNLKTQMDKEHFTFSLRAKVWIIQAELTSKTPVTSRVDGVKISSYYGANIRFFF